MSESEEIRKLKGALTETTKHNKDLLIKESKADGKIKHMRTTIKVLQKELRKRISNEEELKDLKWILKRIE